MRAVAAGTLPLPLLPLLLSAAFLLGGWNLDGTDRQVESVGAHSLSEQPRDRTHHIVVIKVVAVVCGPFLAVHIVILLVVPDVVIPELALVRREDVDLVFDVAVVGELGLGKPLDFALGLGNVDGLVCRRTGEEGWAGIARACQRGERTRRDRRREAHVGEEGRRPRAAKGRDEENDSKGLARTLTLALALPLPLMDEPADDDAVLLETPVSLPVSRRLVPPTKAEAGVAERVEESGVTTTEGVVSSSSSRTRIAELLSSLSMPSMPSMSSESMSESGPKVRGQAATWKGAGARARARLTVLALLRASERGLPRWAPARRRRRDREGVVVWAREGRMHASEGGGEGGFEQDGKDGEGMWRID